MSLSVSSAEDRIYQELNLIGQQIDQSGVFLYLNDAVNYFSTTYALPTSKKSQGMLVFNGVRYYGLPTDFATIGELQRPPALWSPRFMNSTDRELSHWPYGRKTAVQWDGGTPFLDVQDNLDGSQTSLSNCDATTGVTISGDGSALALNNMIYTEGTGSLQFTVTDSSGQTVLTFTGLDQQDITDWLTRNWCFLDLILPSTNTVALSSMKLRIGNDASNYYEMSATTAYRGNTILNGLNQVGFDFTTAVQTGAVTKTSVTWMQVIINNGVSGTSGVYYIDNIFTAQGNYFLLPYYSKNNIAVSSTAAGSKETITLSTDYILCPVECGDALIYKALELIAASPNVAKQDFANMCARELAPKEALLRTLYPVERPLVQSVYYKPKFKNTRRF